MAFLIQSLLLPLSRLALAATVTLAATSVIGAQDKRAPAALWKQLEASSAIVEGRSGAPRTIYVFMDANCPFCTKFWNDARPWVDGGKVQLRYLMVGILTLSSPGKAAALLSDQNPAQALAAHERAHLAESAATVATADPQPLGERGLQPLARIPPAIKRQLDANRKLMTAFGIEGTPGLVWRDGAGAVHARSGAPDSALPVILGPR